jgi:large subunit ribosomal protein L21
MYAVIRTGGKQYRVAPGDVLKIEKSVGDADSAVEFSDVLAFSDGVSPIVKPAAAKVFGTVVSEGRGDKILVFHFKRKKQYKKLQGHRQAYTEIRINSIEVDGFTYGNDKTEANAAR